MGNNFNLSDKYDLDIERSILGLVIKNGDFFLKVLERKITSEQFYAIYKLHREGLTIDRNYY